MIGLYLQSSCLIYSRAPAVWEASGPRMCTLKPADAQHAPIRRPRTSAPRILTDLPEVAGSFHDGISGVYDFDAMRVPCLDGITDCYIIACLEWGNLDPIL